MENLKRLPDYHLSDKFSDMTVRVGTETIRCHRIIMVHGGDFFNTHLTSVSGWRDQDEIDLSNSITNMRVMKNIVGFIYGKEIVYDLLDISLYLQASHFLLFDELFRDCYRYLARCWVPENTLAVWETAEGFGLSNLACCCQELAPYFLPLCLRFELGQHKDLQVAHFIEAGLADMANRDMVAEMADECDGQASVAALKARAEKVTPLFPRMKINQQNLIQLSCGTLYSPARDQFYFWPEGQFRHSLQYMGGDMAVVFTEDEQHWLVNLRSPGNPERNGCPLTQPPVPDIEPDVQQEDLVYRYFSLDNYLWLLQVAKHSGSIYATQWMGMGWSSPTRLYQNLNGSVEMIHVAENAENRVCVIVMKTLETGRYWDGEYLGLIELWTTSSGHLRSEIHDWMKFDFAPLERVTAWFHQDAVVVMSGGTSFRYDMSECEWHINVECDRNCKFHVPIAEEDDECASKIRVYHETYYSFYNELPLLCATQGGAEVWTSGVPSRPGNPGFPCTNVVKLSSSILNWLEPVGRMTNTASRLLGPETVEDMLNDETFFK